MNQAIDSYLERIRTPLFWLYFLSFQALLCTITVIYGIPYSIAYLVSAASGVLAPLAPDLGRLIAIVLSGLGSLALNVIDDIFEYFERLRVIKTYRKKSSAALDNIVSVLTEAGIPTPKAYEVTSHLIAQRGAQALAVLNELNELQCLPPKSYEYLCEQVYAYLRSQAQARRYGATADD